MPGGGATYRIEAKASDFDMSMARKVNYALERKQRAKAKTAKREAKRRARLAARAEDKDKVVDDAKDSTPGTGSASKVPASGD